MVFDLPVVEEKVKPHQVTTLHLICALAFIGTGAIIFTYNYTIPLWGLALLIGGILLLVLTMFKNRWVTRKTNNRNIRFVELLVTVWIAVYSIMQQWKFPIGMFLVLTAAILFAIYWERKAGDQLFIHIDKEGIKLPVGSRKRFIPWTEVEQVIFRFSTLTIDCTGNRLFQWQISDTKTDSDVLESYCTTQVEENKSKRRKDDW